MLFPFPTWYIRKSFLFLLVLLKKLWKNWILQKEALWGINKKEKANKNKTKNLKDINLCIYKGQTTYVKLHNNCLQTEKLPKLLFVSISSNFSPLSLGYVYILAVSSFGETWNLFEHTFLFCSPIQFSIKEQEIGIQ